MTTKVFTSMESGLMRMKPLTSAMVTASLKRDLLILTETNLSMFLAGETSKIKPSALMGGTILSRDVNMMFTISSP